MLRFLRGAAFSKSSPKSSKPAKSRELLEVLGRTVEIHRRARRRSLNLTIHVSGRLRVSAPKSVTQRQIAQFVESQREWLEQNLAKYEKVRSAHPKKRIREGESFPLLGRELTLEFRSAAVGKTKYSVRARESRLLIEIPEAKWKSFDREAEHRELRPLLVKFYQKAGRELIGQRLERMAAAMALKPSAISFRSQKTRWGSCSSKGRISLNWRLIVAPLEVIDYVVVHELSHLECYDHSPAFWKLVSTQIPDYRERRDWLRDHVYDADFLAPRSELHA